MSADFLLPEFLRADTLLAFGGKAAPRRGLFPWEPEICLVKNARKPFSFSGPRI